MHPSSIAIYRHQAAHFFVLPDGPLDMASKISFLRQWFDTLGDYRVGVNWPFGIYRLLSAPARNSLKIKRSPFAVYLHLSLPANDFDGKSDGKIFLRVLFRNFTVKPIRGTRETLQITELLPL